MALSLEEQTRIDLAATFRIIAHLGMHEAVANHFSAAVSQPQVEALLAYPRQ
jgi:ribulose-5-phosphate 4-epimerase/fuculose-1-phosphate aldolase